MEGLIPETNIIKVGKTSSS